MMVEKIYDYSLEESKKVEKIIDDDPMMLNHMVFPTDQGLPEHYSNSNVYMVVVRGTVTLQLDEQEPHKYEKGKIINIPFHTKMNVNNKDEEVLELFVIKAPNPRIFKED